jgi:hypothetical protein
MATAVPVNAALQANPYLYQQRILIGQEICDVVAFQGEI